MKTVKEWLDTEPSESEISYVGEDKSKPYLGIDVVKKLLNEYIELAKHSPSWNTLNFHYSFVDGWVHGSIELQINGRILSGGASAEINALKAGGIDNFVGTIKSMAITNAAKDIGKRFGSELYIKKNDLELDEGGKTFGISTETDYDVFIRKLKSCKSKFEATTMYSLSALDFSDESKKQINKIINSIN
jgi:hypothetical protein